MGVIRNFINRISMDATDIASIINGTNVMLKTLSRRQIVNNRIVLDSVVLGDIAFKKAEIYVDMDTNEVFNEVTCQIVNDNTIVFDPNDGVNDLYAVLTYLKKKD